MVFGGGNLLQIRWHGHSCFEIKDDLTLVTDPHDGKAIGIHAPSTTGDIILVSHDHYDHNSIKSVEKEGAVVITDVKKRKISNIEIEGIVTYHDECCGDKRGNNIIYRFSIDNIKFCHLGDLGHDLDESIIQKIGDIDILFIPIGGTFTVDSKQAWDIIRKMKPKITIPMHYKIGGLSLPISGLDPFLNISDYKILKVGNEIDLEKEDLPDDPEIWTFTL